MQNKALAHTGCAQLAIIFIANLRYCEMARIGKPMLEGFP